MQLLPPGLLCLLVQGRHPPHKRPRSDRTLVTVKLGQVEVEGKGELVGRDTRRRHVVRL